MQRNPQFSHSYPHMTHVSHVYDPYFIFRQIYMSFLFFRLQILKIIDHITQLAMFGRKYKLAGEKFIFHPTQPVMFVRQNKLAIERIYSFNLFNLSQNSSTLNAICAEVTTS